MAGLLTEPLGRLGQETGLSEAPFQRALFFWEIDMLFGHLAAAALMRHYLKTEPLSTLGGSLAPDLADKGLYGLGVVDCRRRYGHTLLGAAVSTAVIYLIWGKWAGQSWLAGYLGHLLADAGGFVPWFYPWKRYTFYPSRRQIPWTAQFNQMTALELALLLWAAWVWRGRCH